jgi:hypothetical protein
MTTLAEIEHAVAALPNEQKLALYQFLQTQLRMSPLAPHSVLDIDPIRLGAVLQPLGGDDLLDEMLEDRP